MIRRLDFAPLDGITRFVFRRVWARRFGGADRIFVPFFSPPTTASSPSGTCGRLPGRGRRICPWCPR